MELWAAIDLLGGSVVTLRQGRESEKTSWKERPAEVASRWEREGADGLHIVDLDAAFGKGSNRELIQDIVNRAEIPVQVGGGVKDEEVAESLLESGVSRVILGSVAYLYPKTLLALLKTRTAKRIVVAADYSSGGEVMVRGWTSSLELTVLEAAKRFELIGVQNLLATAVGQDGTARGPDFETTKRLCSSSKMKILASGGIRTVADLGNLAKAGAAGAVIGRALYDGSIRLAEARNKLGRAS